MTKRDTLEAKADEQLWESAAGTLVGFNQPIEKQSSHENMSPISMDPVDKQRANLYSKSFRGNSAKQS